EMPVYPKLLIVSDIAIIPLPDMKQKMQMIGYLAATANALGIKTPKIACIAPAETLNPNIPSAAEGALLSKMADRGQLGNVMVDGPLSLDVALFKEVAEHKKVKGAPFAGDPDCLLFPNLEAGNVFFKASSHLCHGEIAAMLVGAKKPCVLTSRGDSSQSKLYSIALACLSAK
ncbi:MAG: phosphate butyryltransferase, partial [Alistipes sp.]|nr:phosphate butyryltransferase [Alistipes sp.]